MADAITTTQEVALYDADDLAFASALDTLGRRGLVVIADISSVNNGVANLWQKETLAGKGFNASTPELTYANTTENNILLLKNPSASGKLVRIKDIAFALMKGTTEVKGSFRFYNSPTITSNGTSVAINKILSTQVATSVCTAFHTPVTSARGTLFRKFGTGTMTGGGVYDLDLCVYVPENSNLLITFQGESTSTIAQVSLNFLEV